MAEGFWELRHGPSKPVHREPVGEVKGTDLFPDLREEMDRLILHSETKIKLWVIGAVLANGVAIVLATVPGIYYLGKLSTRMEVALTKIDNNSNKIEATTPWMMEREVWEDSVERQLGPDFHPPRFRDSQKPADK